VNETIIDDMVYICLMESVGGVAVIRDLCMYTHVVFMNNVHNVIR
jgi:hypothetical protein